MLAIGVGLGVYVLGAGAAGTLAARKPRPGAEANGRPRGSRDRHGQRERPSFGPRPLPRHTSSSHSRFASRDHSAEDELRRPLRRRVLGAPASERRRPRRDGGAFTGQFAEAFSARASETRVLRRRLLRHDLLAELSATYQSAVAGANLVDGIPIEVVDSRSATKGEGHVVLEAARQRRAREAISRTVVALQATSGRGHRSKVIGTLDTLENLRRGGRIGSAQALLGSLLSIKPVIEVRNGVVEGESKQRTRGRSLRYIADKVSRRRSAQTPRRRPRRSGRRRGLRREVARGSARRRDHRHGDRPGRRGAHWPRHDWHLLATEPGLLRAPRPAPNRRARPCVTR